MPILPLVDLLILMSTGSLLVGFALKSIDLTTRYNPAILGFSSLDFVIIAGICLAMALVLAARTWVKLNEPKLRGVRSHRGLQRRPALVEDYDDEDDGSDASRPAEAVHAEFR